MKKLLLSFLLCLGVFASASAVDVYLRGDMNNWAAQAQWRFTQVSDYEYQLDNVTISSGIPFKIADDSWEIIDFGFSGDYALSAFEVNTYSLTPRGFNMKFNDDFTGSLTFDSNMGILRVTPKGGQSTDPVTPGEKHYIYLSTSGINFTPYVWAWTNTAVCTINQRWPGDAMTLTDKGWYWECPGETMPGMILFSNNGGEQTDDLVYVDHKTYTWSTQSDERPSDDVRPSAQASGTLPVLHINIYKTDAEGNFIVDGEGNKVYDNDVISRELADKNYRSGEYWLDVNGCQWLIDLGAKSVGSADEPLALEMKARGNYTRTGFSKKPFKLKLGKKQSLLGMSPDKSKHWAILAHADDNYGYMRNFVGFNLGQRIGLPWTPSQQPVEVYINGDYRGLYFLTESIRVGDGRVPITELKDNVTDPELVSGGYLVELDNYDEENQIQMTEQVASGANPGFVDRLRITFDTPEEYSDIQRRFINDQFTAMNNYIGQNNNALWSYMDLDDAARYYVVEEIVSHVESYHGSTYLFRERGEGQKWHFSPLWDFGNAFNGATDQYLYNCDPYGNTWIPSMRMNPKFNKKVQETWRWFMANCYDGIESDIRTYVGHIKAAAQADYERWHNAPVPNGGNPNGVIDNRDLDGRMNAVLSHLRAKTSWLTSQWGRYNGTFPEPERDTTEAAPLPEYAGGQPAPEPEKHYIYLDVNAPFNPPYVWAWNGNVNCTNSGTWPGDEMTMTDNGWYWEYAGETTPANIIFSNPGFGQTKDLTYYDHKTYVLDYMRSFGDVNFDSVVNIADVQRLLNIISGEDEKVYIDLSTGKLVGDLNGDGAINIADVQRLLNILSGEVDEMPMPLSL